MLSLVKTSEIPFISTLEASEAVPVSPFQYLRHFLTDKRKYFCVLGGYLINFLIGGYIAVGNILPYLASYLTAAEIEDTAISCTEEIATRFSSNMTLCNFMLAGFTVGYASFGAIGGFLMLYTSTRVMALLGGSMVVTSFFITSLYTSNVYVIMFCSFGVLYGIGAGFMWSPSILCVLRWYPQSKALLNGTLLSAVTVGSICLSVIETEHINPTNIYSDPGCGYSLHQDVMEKVPGTFTLLAVMATMCTVVGFLCLFDHESKNVPAPSHAIHDADRIERSVDTATTNNTNTTAISAGAVLFDSPRAVSIITMTTDGGYSHYGEETGDVSHHEMSLRDVTVSEALRTSQFWIICGNLMFAMFTISFVYSDWKLIAQTYFRIGDDQFLLSLNMAAAVCGVFGRFFWGLYYDRTKSYRTTVLTVALVTLTAVSTLPLCPAHNEWMLSIWVCVLWFCVSAAYTVFPPALSNNFGDKYCGVLMGFIILSETVATFSQSGVFTFFQSSGMDTDTIWTSLCLEQGLFAMFSVLITSRFEQMKR